jgi:WD40 repeat protein
MAQVQRHRRAIATAFFGLAALALEPALAEDHGPNPGTDLYEHPVLGIDPGMHTGAIRAQAVDADGRFAVTGGDKTVRVWSLADGKLLRTIWIPSGPDSVGDVYAVAISPDGSTIAVGGHMEQGNGRHPIYFFDRKSGDLIRRIGEDLPDETNFLTFSPDGRYLATALSGGLRVFDREKDWREAFRDQYRDSYGAAFALDGHLATTSDEGLVRLYQYVPNSNSPNFRPVGERALAPSGDSPRGIAFSPKGERLAVGYHDAAHVDVLDEASLGLLRAPGIMDKDIDATRGIPAVTWSGDGETLLSAGGVVDNQKRILAWDGRGLGRERRMTSYCGNTAVGIDVLRDGRILVASMQPCVGLMDARGKAIWTASSPVLNFGGQADVMRVSLDGKVVDFGFRGSARPVLRFDVRSLTLSNLPSNDDLTFLPNREGLTIDNWRNGTALLRGEELTVDGYEIARSLAIAPDAKRFFIGSNVELVCYDDAPTLRWRWWSQSEIWAVNASRDGRLVITADSDGAIRWHRADDGRELLALQVLPNKNEPAKWDWVLWTPEGFYEATPGAESMLRWVVNHGPDQAATTLPVSAIAKLHRPNALPLVLSELETVRALGLEGLTQARLDVQARTGSAKPPGGALHVLAIGVDKFGEKAGDLHLYYAAEDAHDVATALLESQKGSAGKTSLYGDVSVTYLSNDKADGAAILDALDDMARSMAMNDGGQSIAVILVSSHGEMIDGQFYLIPYGFDPGSQGRSVKSAVSASEFAKKVAALAVHGKVLVLLDACHSGAVGAQDWAKDPDAKVLEDAMDMENVTVLTSSKKNELSEELPEWKHGALAEAFLDALKGAADSQGIVRLSALTDAMENEVQSLTKGKQHLGMHVNFSGDLFVAGHY